MSTKQRTPEHFPRMKVRGGRRRHGQRSTQGLTPAQAFTSLGEILAEVGRAWERLLDAWFGRMAEALHPTRKRDVALESRQESVPTIPVALAESTLPRDPA